MAILELSPEATFSPLFSQYSLGTYCLPGIELSLANAAVNSTDLFSPIMGMVNS